MSKICSLGEVLQIQTHGKLTRINRNEKAFLKKKINLILLKQVPKCLWLILTLRKAFLMACSITGSIGFCFLFLIRRCFHVLTHFSLSLCNWTSQEWEWNIKLCPRPTAPFPRLLRLLKKLPLRQWCSSNLPSATAFWNTFKISHESGSVLGPKSSKKKGWACMCGDTKSCPGLQRGTRCLCCPSADRQQGSKSELVSATSLDVLALLHIHTHEPLSGASGDMSQQPRHRLVVPSGIPASRATNSSRQAGQELRVPEP